MRYTHYSEWLVQDFQASEISPHDGLNLANQKGQKDEGVGGGEGGVPDTSKTLPWEEVMVGEGRRYRLRAHMECIFSL